MRNSTDRAREHFDSVSRQIDQFLKSKTHTFVHKYDLTTDETWLMWWMDEPTHPPISLSVDIGEFLYNLRSALDNLICALVRRGNPSSTCGRRNFPISPTVTRSTKTHRNC